MNAFSPQQQQQQGSSSINSQAAAALSALQQFVPISLVNTSPFSSLQGLDTNAFAQFAAAAQSQALSSSAAQSLLNAGLGMQFKRVNSKC
jgi:hypothetical protein